MGINGVQNYNNSNQFLVEANYKGNGEIRISDASSINNYVKGLGDTYSYIGIAVPRG